MSDHSDDALALAGAICGTVLYPRFADLVRAAIMNCTLDAQPLVDDQAEQLYRAMCWAIDGSLDHVAQVIDEQTIIRFQKALEEAPDA